MNIIQGFIDMDWKMSIIPSGVRKYGEMDLLKTVVCYVGSIRRATVM